MKKLLDYKKMSVLKKEVEVKLPVKKLETFVREKVNNSLGCSKQ